MVRPPLESTNTIKFLCSYGGKIVPRYPDGKLRYQGGHTRVLAVPRSISFPELMIKMGELCGSTVRLRCQLPSEDLDALITIKSDEDLANLIEEYDRAATTPSSSSSSSSSSSKVRAFLSTKSSKPITLSPSPSESPNSLSPKSLSPSSSFASAGSSPRFVPPPPPVLAYPVNYSRSLSGKKANSNHLGCHHCCRNSGHVYLIHNGNHWQ